MQVMSSKSSGIDICYEVANIIQVHCPFGYGISRDSCKSAQPD